MFYKFSRYIIRLRGKNKLDFSLNLVGLSVAIVVFILASLYVKNETSYDNFHANANRIFRLTTSLSSPSGQETNMALANPSFAYILKNNCNEIEEIACVDIGDVGTFGFNGTEIKNVAYRLATPSVFDVFSYPVIIGNQNILLKEPNTIVLTKTLSEKIFGNQSPIGQVLTVNKEALKVTGVIEDLPSNTNLQFEALCPSEVDAAGNIFDWGDYYVYIKANSTEVSGLSKTINEISGKEYHDFLEQMSGYELFHRLQPLTQIHFDNSLLADTPKGNKNNVYVFSIIAILILIIAGINYTNLTIAQLEKRQKEFAIRKTTGCSNYRIISIIVNESLFNTLLATILATIIVILLLPGFNNLFSKDFGLVSILNLILPLLIIFMVFGILTGLLPALRTSKTTIKKSLSSNLFGKSLVTFQNTVSIFMIIGVLFIWKQIQFMKNSDLGFNKEQLLAITIPENPEKFPGEEVLKQEFCSIPGINSVAFGGGGTNLGAKDHWMKAIMAIQNEAGENIQFIVNQPNIDENYIDLFEIEVLKGHNFTPDFSDPKKHVIINEAYATVMGWDEPVGKFIDNEKNQEVIGLVKDFHFDALNNPVEPIMFKKLTTSPAFIFLRTTPSNLEKIKEKWKNIFVGETFECSYIDQRMAGLYKKNETEMTIFSFLTLIAVIISCLGHYGLTSHFIVNRTKEIGIRKVNGANEKEITLLLNHGFIKWVTIAFIAAVAIGYIIMNKWLENFACKTSLSWWLFALAGSLALGIAVITVSFQSYKAATRNPVEALRYE